MSAPFVSIASHLPRMAELEPHSLAIVYPEGRDRAGKVRYTHLTYAQLDEQSDLIARGLATVGIGRGVRTVLMVRPSLDFFALTFALVKGGAVPIMIDPGIGRPALKTCLAETEPAAFIGVPKAHAARVVFGWGRATLETHVTVGRRWFWGGTTLERVKQAGRHVAPKPLPDFAPEDVAALVFTSGSTGRPKAVVYTHGNFVAQVEMIRDLYDIRPGEIDLPTFPLFALFDPALGMTTIVPDMDPTRPADVDPSKIIEAVEDYGVTNMFASPALLDTVGRYGVEHGVKLPSSLRRVISAGAPVSATIMERLLGMMDPKASVVTPYGATESLPVASISSDEVLGETRSRTDEGAGVCVGYPVDRVHVSIIGIDDQAIELWDEALCLPLGEIGEIVVMGPAVTRSYCGRDDATLLAKIPVGRGDDFYHRMGDVGYFDERGRLWFCGRKAHRVVTAERTYFTVPCEAVFNTHPKVYRTALVGVRRDDEIRPVLCVELERDAIGDDSLTCELRSLGSAHEHTRAINTVLYHAGFPVDIRHNAKIGREKLAGWATAQIG